MSHEFSSGVFTKGEPAWHGLGTVINGTAPAREAFRLANADWEVLSLPVFNANLEEIPGYQQIVRGDNGLTLSVQPESYSIVQNEQLIRIAEAIEHEATISAVCVLAEGRRVTFSAEINGAEGEPVPGDSVKQYLIGVTSHDGRVAFQTLFSPIRVVCQNTLSAALGAAERGDSSRRVKVRHTKNANDLIRHIPDIISVQRQQFNGGIAELKAMAAKPCSMDDFRQYVSTVFADQLTGTVNEVRGDDTTARPKRLEDLPLWDIVSAKFNGAGIGFDIPGVRGSFWGAYQAITEFMSHDVGRTRNRLEAERQRLESIYWGAHANVLTRAHTIALAATRV